MPAQTGVTTHYNLVIIRHGSPALHGIRSRKTYDINGVQTLAYATADSAADTGYTLN